MKAIYILWLRQLKRYYRSPSRLIGSFGQPLLFLIALGYGFGSIFQRAGGGNYIEFLSPGIIAQSVLFTSIFSGVEIIWDRQFGFLKETLVAPVSRLNIVIGRTLGGATVAVIQGLIVLILSLFIGFQLTNFAQFPLAVIFIILLALLFTALGTAIASSIDDIHGFQLIMNFLVMPLFFLSSALFPLQGLPKVFQMIASVNPLSYGVDGIRGSLTGVSYFGLTTDFLVLSTVTTILLFIGSYLFSRIQV